MTEKERSDLNNGHRKALTKENGIKYRISKALDPNQSLEVKFTNRGSSPLEVTQFHYSLETNLDELRSVDSFNQNTGNQTCSRCHDLKKELDAKRTEMKTEHEIKIDQLRLKHKEETQTLEKEIKDMDTKIKFKMHLTNELEQKIEKLRKEKNEIELQLRDEKAEMEKELTNTKEKLVGAEQRITKVNKANTDSRQEKNELLSQLIAQRNETKRGDQKLTAERTLHSFKMELCRKEKEELQLKCQELQEKLKKSKNFVGRVFLPSGNDFHRSGVICALKRDTSAKLIATRSSDGPGNASDIFNHRGGTNSGTSEKSCSWWCIDLGKTCLLLITHYALRHGKSDGESILRHWQLQGSIDGISWKTLETCERDNPSDPPKFRGPHPFVTGTWSVKNEVEAFRYFRILQTGRNSSGTYGIYLSGVELYGILLDV